MSGDLSGFSLYDLFRGEVEGQVATLADGLLALERAADSAAALEALMRAAHSLKGAARIVDAEAAVQVAHALEDCFVAAQRGQVAIGPNQVDVLLRGVDFLANVGAIAERDYAAWQAQNTSRVETILTELAAVLRGESPPATINAPAETIPEPAAPPPPAPGVESTPVATPPPPPDTLAPAPEPAAPATPAQAADAPEAVDRVVRVSARNMDRLLGFAGESLVETRRLQGLVDQLLALRVEQARLQDSIRMIEVRVQERGADALTRIEEPARVARESIDRFSLKLTSALEPIEQFARGHVELAERLHHEVLSSRMRPMTDGTRGFARMVRDGARRLGKQVRFEQVGEKVGVDRDILEKLEAPLNHLIRNALDHAIEMPEERLAAGKAEAGVIGLEARHRAGSLQIQVRDDGRGIDVERVRAKVVERGLTNESVAARLSEAEVLEFLFLPGFSTRGEVTEMSGRGVGLDVVQSMAQAVGGGVRVATKLGRGTTFTLHLPITISVIRALLVEVAGEPLAFPLTRIDRILHVESSAVNILEGKQHIRVDDAPVGLVDAAQILELPRAGPRGDACSIVLLNDRSQRFGLVVDRFLGERDLQVRPLDPRLGKVADINSVAILDDGTPVLIVDVEDLIRSIDTLLGGRRLRKVAVEAKARRRPSKRILVVDDSVTVRELERQLLETHGYAVDVAVDGDDGWNALQAGDYKLVVSDVDMPRLDGIQLVRQIKQDPVLQSTPVVIVSYKDRQEDRLRGLDAGANAYLTKSSFHDRTFLETIVDLIGEPRD